MGNLLKLQQQKRADAQHDEKVSLGSLWKNICRALGEEEENNNNNNNNTTY